MLSGQYGSLRRLVIPLIFLIVRCRLVVEQRELTSTVMETEECIEAAAAVECEKSCNDVDRGMFDTLTLGPHLVRVTSISPGLISLRGMLW